MNSRALLATAPEGDAPMLGVADCARFVQKTTRVSALVIIEETWRLLSCARCGLQLRLCPECDIGQRYCGAACSGAQRRQAQREASRAFQRTRRGRRLHAVRMQRCRDRKRRCPGKLLDPKVTQQWVTQDVGEARSEGALLITGDLLARAQEVPTHVPIMHCTLRVTQHDAKLLVRSPEGDLLRARLDTRPCHPRALLTLLEGLSLWSGEPLSVALYADERCQASLPSTLFGDELWPAESPLVRFDIVHRVRQRARLAGLADARSLRRGRA